MSPYKSQKLGNNDEMLQHSTVYNRWYNNNRADSLI